MADPTLEALEGRKDEETVYIENLLSSTTVYHSDKTKDKYEMEPHGFSGSIASIPVKVAKESYLRRAIQRGKIAMLTDQQASEREALLSDSNEAASETNRVLEPLKKGASENSSRFTRKGLSDDGSELPGQTAEQVWASTVTGSVSDKAPSTVRRSDTQAVPDVPAEDLKVIIEDTVKEGDPQFRSETGL